MTRLPRSASVLHAAGRFASKNCPSSIPTTSVSSSTSFTSSSEVFTFCDGIRMSLWDTMWSSLKRSSSSGLKICTFCFAICARRRRRINSSLLPLNMLPVTTSIQPWWASLRMTSISSQLSTLHAGLVFSGFRADADLVALVDERRDVDDEAGFERRRLDLRARGRALDAGHRFLDDEIYGRRQLDADRLHVVELHTDDGVRNEVVLRVAHRFVRNVDLLVGRRVHEVVMVAVVVQILHLALVERRALDVLLGSELLIGQRAGPDIA